MNALILALSLVTIGDMDWEPWCANAESDSEIEQCILDLNLEDDHDED